MNDDKSVIYAYLRAELADAHRCIRAIWDAPHNQLSAAVAEATRCLPPELRTPEMPALDDGKTTRTMQAVLSKARVRREPVKENFDDILG